MAARHNSEHCGSCQRRAALCSSDAIVGPAVADYILTYCCRPSALTTDPPFNDPGRNFARGRHLGRGDRREAQPAAAWDWLECHSYGPICCNRHICARCLLLKSCQKRMHCSQVYRTPHWASAQRRDVSGTVLNPKQTKRGTTQFSIAHTT